MSKDNDWRDGADMNEITITIGAMALASLPILCLFAAFLPMLLAVIVIAIWGGVWGSAFWALFNGSQSFLEAFPSLLNKREEEM